MYLLETLFNLAIKFAQFSAVDVRFSQVLLLLMVNKSFEGFRAALGSASYRRFFVFKLFLYSYCGALMRRSFLLA